MLPEISEYLTELQSIRRKILATLEETDSAAWNWAPVGDETNSLYVLATHAIGSEHGWIYEILGRGEKTRVRSEEFKAQGNDLGSLHAEFQKVAAETEAVLANRTSEDLLTTRHRDNYGDVTERWIILHVIQHACEHLGQMYLTKQLWEQSKATQ